MEWGGREEGWREGGREGGRGGDFGREGRRREGRRTRVGGGTSIVAYQSASEVLYSLRQCLPGLPLRDHSFEAVLTTSIDKKFAWLTPTVSSRGDSGLQAMG